MGSALLLSGGIDSIAIAFWKRPTLAITIDYGQVPAEAEIQASREVCRVLDIEHEVIHVDCSSLGSGHLSGRSALPLAPVPEWWPYRNQLLITLAGPRVLARSLDLLRIGTVSTDGSHVDGTAGFVAAISGLMELQEGHIRVEAPALSMSSVELVKRSGVPLDILAWAHSCHLASFACGYCRGCRKHFETMQSLGIGPY